MADQWRRIRPSLYTGCLADRLRGDADAWALATYLLTGPHSTMIGMGRWPVSYMAEDLGLDRERVMDALERLSASRTEGLRKPLPRGNGGENEYPESGQGDEKEGPESGDGERFQPFLVYDHERQCLLILEQARHEWGESPNARDNRVKSLLASLPGLLSDVKKSFVYREFMARYGKTWAHLFEALEDRTGPIPEPSASPSQALPKPSASRRRQGPNKEKEKEKEKEKKKKRGDRARAREGGASRYPPLDISPDSLELPPELDTPALRQALAERIRERSEQPDPVKVTATSLRSLVTQLQRVAKERGVDHAVLCLERATAAHHQGVVFVEELETATKNGQRGMSIQPEVDPLGREGDGCEIR